MNEEKKDPGVQETPVTKKQPFGGKRRRWLLVALVTVAAVGAVAAMGLSRPKAQAATSYFQETAALRDVTKRLSGGGTLQPADSYTVNTLVSGEVLTDTFEEGDLVDQGALLYTLDASNAQNGQTQAQRSYDSARKAKYPTADMGGTISEVYVKNGDAVSGGTELCRIVGDNTLTVDFLFTYVDEGAFYVGQNATVFLNGFAGTISGKVTAVSASTTPSSTGRELTTVRVEAVNPGLVTEDYTASAVVGDYSSYGSAKVHLSGATVVKASGSGTVSNLKLLAGDVVAAGDQICVLTGDAIDDQIENARLALSNAQDTLENYSVTAPISGTVVTKTAKAGDKVEGGGSGALCTIYDLSHLEMTLNVDELDIGAVAVGQTVQITADAVEGRTYTGVVTKVSVAGNTSGGTTTYPVTIRIDETEGLLPGMNVDAEIVISSALGVLAIPNGAVNRGNTVLLTADSPSAANALADRMAPEGYVYVQVETGVSDESYIEIISGLQAGDVVAYLPTSSGGGMSMMMMPGVAMGGNFSVSTSMSGGGPRG